jgi:signal peptidase I
MTLSKLDRSWLSTWWLALNGVLHYRVSRMCVLAAVTATFLVSRYYGTRLSPFTIVCGRSMEPNIPEWTLLRVDHRVPQAISRGTVVLTSVEGEPMLLKRVIGLPHEHITFLLGEVFVDGRMLREPYLGPDTTTFSWEKRSLVAGDDEYVLLGDNRLVSRDSRSFGPIPRGQIVGIVDVSSPRPQFKAVPEFRCLPQRRWRQEAKMISEPATTFRTRNSTGIRP